MKGRVKTLRKTLNLNQADFAALLGLKGSTVSMIEIGRNPLSEQNIRLICKTFNVNEQWLRTGEGETFGASPYETEFLGVYQELVPETQAAILRLARDILKTQKKLLGAGGKTAAGDGEPEAD